MKRLIEVIGPAGLDAGRVTPHVRDRAAGLSHIKCQSGETEQRLLPHEFTILSGRTQDLHHDGGHVPGPAEDPLQILDSRWRANQDQLINSRRHFHVRKSDETE